MIASAESIVVGLGEMYVKKGQTTVLSCIGLGSCIAFCAYDPVTRVGGVAHMVLPSSNGDRKQLPAKYVDTGIPVMIAEMERQGAVRSRLAIKAAGGAQMLSIPGVSGRNNVGERNIEALHAAMAGEGITAIATDLGGNRGRTLKLYLDTGKVTVRKVDGETIEL